MNKLIIVVIIVTILFVNALSIFESKVYSQTENWTHYKNDKLGIIFDYPASWIISEKNNRFEQGPDLSIGSAQQTFTYTAPTMDIQYFDAYIQGLSIGLSIGTPYSNLQIVENYNLNTNTIDNQSTATALYAYDVNGKDRTAVEEFLIYKDYQVHKLKFQDSASSFDSPNFQKILLHIIKSFHFVESPLRELHKYDIVLSSEPTDYWTLRQKADLLFQLGNYSEAIKTYDRILDLDSVKDYNRDAVLNDKGYALNLLGKYSDSIKTFEILMNLGYPNDSPEYMIGQNLVALGNLTGAISWYDKALEKVSENIYTHLGKGEALEKLGRYNDALKSYDNALNINSTDPTALSNKETLLNFLSKNHQSKSETGKPLYQGPLENTLGSQASAAYDLGNYSEAIKYFDLMLKSDPNNTNALIFKGNALHALGNFEAAIDVYDKVLDVDSNNSMALNNKGLVLSKLGNYSESIKFYDRALLSDPSGFNIHNNKGYSLFKLGKVDEAITSTSKAIRINHDYPEAWYNLAIYYLAKDTVDESLSSLRNSIMLNPEFVHSIREDKDFDKIRNNTLFIDLMEEFLK